MEVSATIAITLSSIILGCILVVVLVVLLRWYIKGPMCRCESDLHGKTVLITGCNTGIGKYTAKGLIQRGARVIMACRSLDKARATAGEIRKDTGCGDRLVEMKLDLSDMNSVREFAALINEKESSLHVLINNAGIMGVPYSKTKQGIELTMATNHFGHFLLTLLLLELLKKSTPSRIVTVSSLGHIIGRINFDHINYDDSSFGTIQAYADSKLANVLFMRELAKRLEGTGVTTYSLHPGSIYTDISRNLEARLPSCVLACVKCVWVKPTRFLFFKSWEQGAQTSIHCAVSEQCADASGLYYSDCKVKRPGRNAQDDEVARKLWDVSVKMVGYSDDTIINEGDIENMKEPQ